MKAFVGIIMGTVPSKKWPYKYACHLFADTVPGLVFFAKQLGLKREWLQRSNGVPHFDLTKSKRIQALQMGAKQLTRESEIGKEHTVWQCFHCSRGTEITWED